MAASFLLGNGGLGMALQHSGDADYKEQSLELAYGKNLGRLQIWVSILNYQLDQATGYQAVGFGSAAVGYVVSCFMIN